MATPICQTTLIAETGAILSCLSYRFRSCFTKMHNFVPHLVILIIEKMPSEVFSINIIMLQFSDFRIIQRYDFNINK